MSGEERVKDVSLNKRGSLPRLSGIREKFKKKSKSKPPSKWFGLVCFSVVGNSSQNFCGQRLTILRTGS